MSTVLGENALVKVVNWAKETFVAKGETGGSSGIPSGCICIWSGTTPPEGWALCDGENGTPDLRGRFVLGYSNAHTINSKGGTENVTLSLDNMPAHSHDIVCSSGKTTITASEWTSASISSGSPQTKYRTQTTTTGRTTAHNNMPPYYTLAYIMRL